jgi:hypothetical protein
MVQNINKRRFSIIWIISALVLLTTAGIVMILLGTVPGIYQPFARPGSGEVSPYLTHDMGPDFFTGMQGEEPFEMVFQQWGVNEMLALTTESMVYGEFTVSSPTVVFSPDSFVLMATVQVKTVSSVLTITARPVMDQDGLLNMNVQSATLGAIPVLGLIRRIGQQVADEYLVGTDEQEFAGIVNSVLNNEPFEPIVSVSEYNMRLKALTLEEGKVRLLIEPVKDKDVRGVGGSRVP